MTAKRRKIVMPEEAAPPGKHDEVQAKTQRRAPGPTLADLLSLLSDNTIPLDKASQDAWEQLPYIVPLADDDTLAVRITD